MGSKGWSIVFGQVSPIAQCFAVGNQVEIKFTAVLGAVDNQLHVV